MSNNNNTILIDGLELEIDNYIVKYQNNEIEFTSKEFEILQLLMVNANKVFSREELLTIVWGYDFYEVNDTVYLGEMTFTPGAATFKYNDPYNKIVGDMLKL